MIFPHIERAYRPGVDFTDAADFLFYKRGNLPSQDAFAIFGTPDKVISQFVGDMFGALCIHTQHDHICSNLIEDSLIWRFLPWLKHRGIRATNL
jgi:hypothetical protein